MQVANSKAITSPDVRSKRWDDARLLTAHATPIAKLVDRHCDILHQFARAAINALEHNLYESTNRLAGPIVSGEMNLVSKGSTDRPSTAAAITAIDINASPDRDCLDGSVVRHPCQSR
ncbi:hypothetical protein [Mesorhizobium japonicum]|uniref:hypothetical protein n=1 Tax=Mesorhizobium japonicum TaxID=2066070 RepID=UPI0012FEFA96|nr:hypothetical protein [Mesorhizobium japonicum]